MELETRDGYVIIHSRKLAMVLGYMLQVKYTVEITDLGKHNHLFEDNKEFRDMLDIVLKYKKPHK